MSFQKRITSVWLLAAMILAAMSVDLQGYGEDWPTFRGKDRTAVSGETGLKDEWGRSGPQLLWSAKGAGTGYASTAVAAGRVYTLGDVTSATGQSGQYLSCYDLKSGEQLWTTPTGPAWNTHAQRDWNGARCTPTIDEDRVYCINADGTLFCVTTAGSILWQTSLVDDLGGKKHDGWGYSESPLVDGELLICTPGGPKATMVALDKRSGHLQWKCSRPRDVGAGHSSIVISHVNGRKIYVQNTGGGPMGVDAKTGTLLWTYDIPAPTAFIPTPIIKDDYVFSVAGYGTGGCLLRQVPDGRDKVTVEEVYGLKKDLDNKHGGVVLVGDFLYAGSQDRNQIFCAELLTGNVRWKKRGAGSNSASVISADGKLFVRFQNGIVALAKVSPEDYIEVSSFQTPASGQGAPPSWAHPVISDGRLLLREDDVILCYDIKK